MPTPETAGRAETTRPARPGTGNTGAAAAVQLTLGVPGAPDTRQGAPRTTPPASVRSLNLSLRISESHVCVIKTPH